MTVTFGNNFDFEKTYSEYGFVTTPLEECIDRFESLFSGITAIHFLHNCAIVKTMNLGTDIDFITEVKDKMGALTVGVAVFTPYIKDETNSLGLVYNVFFDKNCCPVKYPKK